MTGLYPSTHGMWDCTHTQRAEWVDVPADRFIYFSSHLDDAGYHNGYFGKWHVEQSGRLEDFGWHEYDCDCKSRRGEMLDNGNVVVPKTGYRDYLLAAIYKDSGSVAHPAFDKGIQFIRTHIQENNGKPADQRKPFCCFVSTTEPHDPYIPPERFLDMYDIDKIRPSPTLRDEPVGKPEVIRRMREVWKGLSDDDWKRIAAAYWAVISFLDSEVGRIIDVLKEHKIYNDTIIVFTSDHGDMLGGHGLATKGVGTSYEEVYNIPLIIKLPGMKEGREEGASLVSLLDVGPTLLDLAEAEPLRSSHGKSLRPILEGVEDSDDWQEGYAEFFGQRFVYTQRIVWHRDLKYVFNPGGIDELYNLANDPHERENLAGVPQYRNVLHDMVKRMWRKMKEIGDESLFNTHYATLRTAPVGPGALED